MYPPYSGHFLKKAIIKSTLKRSIKMGLFDKFKKKPDNSQDNNNNNNNELKAPG